VLAWIFFGAGHDSGDASLCALFLKGAGFFFFFPTMAKLVLVEHNTVGKAVMTTERAWFGIFLSAGHGSYDVS
jgi:hypothetical protein